MAARVVNPALELMTRDELDRLVEARLAAQVGRCYQRIPFYRRRWPAEAAQVRTFEDFRRLIPFVTKADMLDESEAGDRLAVSPSELFQFHLTSGTSGLGQEVHPLTYSDYESMGSTWIYQTYWAGLEPGDRIAFTFPVGLQTGGLASCVVGERTGLLSIQLGPYGTDAKVDYLLKFQPHGLVATPAYLTRIATELDKRGLQPRETLPSLRAIFIAAESYSLEWAERAQERWGCRLSEWYGTMQGLVNAAFSCELGVVHAGVRGGLHLMEHRIFFEILRPGTDQPVEPGEEGEIVKTVLFRQAFPLVRFRTNDRARLLAGRCSCGRPFRMIEAGTIARYDDMFKVRGQNIWPELVDRVVFADDRVDEYAGRVTVDEGGREKVDIDFELRPSVRLDEAAAAALVSRLEGELKRTTGVNMALRLVPSGTVPRFQFKVRRWTDTRKGQTPARQYQSD